MKGDSENDILLTIKDKIQNILNQSFKEPYRRKIETYSDRIGFCCPICGDSHSDIRKKRGNLYLDSLRFHCYNCGAHMGINTLLKKFNEDLNLEDKLIVNEIQQSSKKLEKRNTSSQSSMTYNILEKLAIPKSIFFKNYNLITPYKNEFSSNYLKSRKIDITAWKYFAFNEKTKELYILNITQQDRIIGFQIRQLNEKSKKPRYLTRSISKMYREIFDKDINNIIQNIINKLELGSKYIEEEDGIENISANIDRLSGLFNIMNIDMYKTLSIVEGPIDSLAINNCIALQGATKMNNYFDNVENVRYIFDNDVVGKQHSIKKIKEHKSVFLWEMYLKSIKCNDKIKDINDLQKSNKYIPNIFNDCFSNDELDVVMI